ncbi:MAG: hypothetical protein JNN11_04635, partial [Candidatus Doudnabacteria bacterium]|nr:hypothetical protein [Candidatus Doudnabacteria bacterium]
GVAINPSNANIIYVLTGDGNGGTNWGYYVKERGCGVYKSTDGGLSFQTQALPFSGAFVNFLLMNPNLSQIVYAGGYNIE